MPAKITRPLLAGCLPRRRLFGALDKARKKPLVWIAGPPGSGKTTLTSSYIQQRKLPAIWCQVDEGDTDLATFFYYLALAGKRAAPHRKKPLPLLTPEYLPGHAIFARQFFEDLFSRLKAGSVLVFDNCQSVADNSLIHDVLREATSLLPDGMSIILISRSAPPPEYARLRANDQMDSIGWRDLRLSPEETLGIARLRMKIASDRKTARELHSLTGGWAAGMIILLERARLEGVKPQSLKRQTIEEIIDYFTCEVLRNLEPGMRDFLLQSAFLPRITAGTAAALTGQSGAGRILSFLHRQNYFTYKLLSDEPTYEFHALFREFLMAGAVEAFPPEQIRRIRRTAGRLLEAAGQFEVAVGLYREAEDWEGLARVIMSQAPAFLAQGRGGMLLEWLSHLPAEAVEANPWLLCWKGFCLLPMHHTESRVCFEKAFPLFRSQSDAAGVFLSWAGAVESIAYGMQNFDLLDPWMSLMGSLLEEHRTFPSVEIEARVTNAMIKALFVRRGHVPGVETWAQRALAISRSPVDPQLKAESLFGVVLFWLARGDLFEVESALNSLKSLVAGIELSPLSRITHLWMEASYAVLRAEFDRCLKCVSEGMALAEGTGVHVFDAMLLGHGAVAELHLGNLPAARTFLHRMEAAVALAGSWDKDYFHFLSACEAMLRGDAAAIANHAERSRQLGEEVGCPDSLALTTLLATLVAHDLGDTEQAAAHLARALSVVERGGTLMLGAACQLVKAYLHLESGDRASALPALASGMRGARESGFCTLYIPKAGFLERLAAAALEAGIEVDHARELIRRNRLRPDPGRSDLEQWPWPIKVYTLGRFSLLRQDKPVEFPRKVQQKPLLLLKTLIAMGGREVPEEQITDALWPEAEGDLAHQSFTAALHRLRQLFGEEEALELKDGKLALSNRVCWVDAWAFERLIGDAEKFPPVGGREARRVALLERALAFYTGSFLPDQNGAPACSSMRARLRSKFLRSAEELGKHLEKGERWEEAASCYRKGLDADELAEAFYHRLIACCLKSGREVEALSVYRRCEKALASAQGVKPSPEILVLLKAHKIPIV